MTSSICLFLATIVNAMKWLSMSNILNSIQFQSYLYSTNNIYYLKALYIVSSRPYNIIENPSSVLLTLTTVCWEHTRWQHNIRDSLHLVLCSKNILQCSHIYLQSQMWVKQVLWSRIVWEEKARLNRSLKTLKGIKVEVRSEHGDN